MPWHAAAGDAGAAGGARTVQDCITPMPAGKWGCEGDPIPWGLLGLAMPCTPGTPPSRGDPRVTGEGEMPFARVCPACLGPAPPAHGDLQDPAQPQLPPAQRDQQDIFPTSHSSASPIAMSHMPFLHPLYPYPAAAGHTRVWPRGALRGRGAPRAAATCRVWHSLTLLGWQLPAGRADPLLPSLSRCLPAGGAACARLRG